MKVMRSVIVDATIDAVWSAIRRFDGVAEWNPGVSGAKLETGSATAVGSIRWLDIADGTFYRETLLAHSDQEHFYTYDIIESPLKCQNYIATHGLVEITEGNKTLSYWRGEFDCDSADAEELEHIVGDLIYRDAQLALNTYLKEITHD